jgi:hypothetical protein
MKDAEQPIYMIQVKYVAKDWLFIGSGESLILLVDGERMRFEGNGSANSREVNEYAVCFELATYLCTPDELRKIAKARKIEVKIIGANSYLLGKFKDDNILHFIEYVNAHVK